MFKLHHHFIAKYGKVLYRKEESNKGMGKIFILLISV